MIAPVLIAASVALITLQSDKVCFPEDDRPIVLPREDGIIYDIRWPTGKIGTGSNNASVGIDSFAGFGQLHVNGVLYEAEPTDPFCLDPDDPRTIVCPPVELHLPEPDAALPGLVEVSRKIRIPWEANRNYARYYDRIRNDTDMDRPLHITFVGKIGGKISDAEPELIKAGKGWVAIDTDANDNTTPHDGILFERDISDLLDGTAPERRMRVWLVFNPSDHSVIVHYTIMLRPREEIAIVNFVTHNPKPTPKPPPADLNSESIDGAEPAGAGPTAVELPDDLEELRRRPDLSNLTEDERSIIMNFMFADTDINMDGIVNILDMIIVRNNLGKDPTSGGVNPRADVNADNSINILDMILVRNDLGWPF